jgi:hypothetical protein
MNECTHIHGIGSSEALDTSGEIVSILGLDISSLVGAPINFEHESKIPSQIVGKIIEAHKIFSAADCQNPHHLYFWKKCQIPFLYIKGRLFDDKKPSSKEIAALFKDDAEHPEEPNIIGFSIEGSKLEKQGAVITRSIARKLTCTCMPANKSCIAEMAPPKEEKADPNDVGELFKGEMQLFSFEPTYIQILEKKQELRKDVGSGGGAFIGSQLAMSEDEELEKSGWRPRLQVESRENSGAGVHFSHPSHGDVKVLKNPKGHFEVHHNSKMVAGSPNPSKATAYAKQYMGGLGKEEKMEKAISAGSGMAAPGQLVDGAALAPESLDRKKMHKKEKSHWYDRADQAYKTWDKREHFRQYMKKRMPHLAEGEVDAIGRTLALRKDVQKEKNLSKMFASHYIKSEDLNKQADGTDVMMASEHIHGLPSNHPALGQHKGHIYRRTAPPTPASNNWHWSVRSPKGKDFQVKLPASTAGSKESIHSHIDSLKEE